jgi:PHD/YefM family antitoxin component YafN of YafNO toxin-antitoxin module
MLTIHPQYITDNTGKKMSVVLTMKEFKAIMEELEELEDIRLYDKAKKSNEPSVPIDEAFKIIEAKRKQSNGL